MILIVVNLFLRLPSVRLITIKACILGSVCIVRQRYLLNSIIYNCNPIILLLKFHNALTLKLDVNNLTVLYVLLSWSRLLLG